MFLVIGTLVGVLLLSPMLLKAQGLGKIVFVSNRDGNSEIYVMNADGTDQKRLTSNSAVDRDRLGHRTVRKSLLLVIEAVFSKCM
jgi:hypothetical protein